MANEVLRLTQIRLQGHWKVLKGGWAHASVRPEREKRFPNVALCIWLFEILLTNSKEVLGCMPTFPLWRDIVITS